MVVRGARGGSLAAVSDIVLQRSRTSARSSLTHPVSPIDGHATPIGSSGGQHTIYAQSSSEGLYDYGMAADYPTIHNFNQHAHSDEDIEKRAQPSEPNMGDDAIVLGAAALAHSEISAAIVGFNFTDVSTI